MELELLLKLARSNEHDKTYCGIKDIIAMLDDGADIMMVNRKDMSGRFMHEISYFGYVFITVTPQKVKEFNNYR